MKGPLHAFLDFAPGPGNVGVRVISEGNATKFTLYFGPGLPAIEEQAEMLKHKIDLMLAAARRVLTAKEPSS